MTVVTALVVFILGAIVGFIVNHLLSSSNQEQRKLSEQVSKSEAALSQYKLDVSEHLESSATLLEQMNATCQTAMKQMQESTQLLKHATTADTDTIPFFSQETQDQLAQTAILRHPKKVDDTTDTVTEAPLDYSSQSSGLFVDKKPKETSNVA